MINELTFAQLEQMRGSALPWVFFVWFNWALKPEQEATLGPTRYVCSAMRNIEWDGHTWLGYGRVASISPIKESASGEAQSVRLTLPAVDPQQRARVLQDDIQGTECKVWVGFFDANEQLIDTPIQEYRSWLDVPTVEDVVDSKKRLRATISITVEGLTVDFARGGRARRFTHADQIEAHPGDMFFEFVGAMKEKSLGWGVPGGPR